VDDLPGDDEASTVLPARTRKHVLAVTPGNRYLEAALLLDEMLDVEQLAPAQYRDATGFDVVIFDGFVPATPPLVPALYLAPKPSAGSFPFAVRGSVDRPFFDHVEDHDPLLRFTALRDVNIAHSLVLAPEPGDQVLAGSTKAPLLVRGTRNGQPMLALAFDVRDSDLPLRAAWPLLLLHALEGLTESPDSRDALRSLGHVEAAGTASLAPRKLVGSIATRIAVAPPPTRAPLPARDPWFLLAALAALIVVVEWCTYQRRWTV
jgi:hypothetical protein